MIDNQSGRMLHEAYGMELFEWEDADATIDVVKVAPHSVTAIYNGLTINVLLDKDAAKDMPERGERAKCRLHVRERWDSKARAFEVCRFTLRGADWRRKW